MAQAAWDRMVLALQQEGYVHCKACGKEAHLGDAVEDEWHRMGPLPLSFDPLKAAPSAFWICPECATTESTTATAASASQLAPTTATTTDTAGAGSQEVQRLKAEVVELKAEIERLKADVVELKFELLAGVQRHKAYQAAHDEDIQKLKQKVDKLTAQVTAVPDDDDSSHEC